MGMMMQVLSPGVEHRDQPDLGAEVLGIGSDDAQRLGCGSEQDGVDHGFVLECDLGDRHRYGDDNMEVRHRQQIGLAVGQPRGPGQPLALRAMPVAAGIIRDADLAAAVALFGMPAQGCRAAGFDRTHDTALAAPQMAGMGIAVSGTVAAQDIRHLQRAMPETVLIPSQKNAAVVSKLPSSGEISARLREVGQQQRIAIPILEAQLSIDVPGTPPPTSHYSVPGGQDNGATVLKTK
jgi:hypothetical protein